MSNQPEHRDEPAPKTATPEGLPQDELLDYVQVGERVTAVLESAKRAADEIRVKARREAERVRAEAEDHSKATAAEAARNAEEIRREADQLRAEAKRYSAETRGAADAYAAESRGEADTAAARAISEAEERAKKVNRDAQRRARQSEEEARKRQAAIVAEAGRFEDRLQNLLTVFRGMTAQLEDLLATKQHTTDDGLPAEDTLEESLEKALRPEPSEPSSA